MKLSLNDKTKIDMLVALFQLLKNCSSVVKLEFFTEYLLIQGMDKSHVCLFMTNIKSNWFTTYDNTETNKVMIDSSSVFMILSRILDNQILLIDFINNNDYINIDVLCNENNQKKKDEYNRYFQLPLIDIDLESLSIPAIEYDADFSINAKQFNDLISQLNMFGDILIVTCNESEINLESNGENGKMKVAISIDDLSEFSIAEGEQLELSYSLPYINKMCLSTKLSKDIDISISNDYPIRLKYNLGEDSYLEFFVAPKI